MKPLLRCCLLLAGLALSGCNIVVMNPAGDIALQERNLILTATGLMLIIIIPVIAMTLFFAWKYRASNTSAEYAPDWHHSNKIEMAVWGAPVVIILILGTVTWFATHRLDPWKPLDHAEKPLTVQVVALDWKWLFIYPEYGVASVNEMAAPVGRPINFEITSSTVMNSFFVPAIAGQIYAMAGMETKLHAIADRTGVFDGFSANFSGDGFSHMRFKLHALEDAGFEEWVAKARSSNGVLTREAFLKLEKPSEKEPVRQYASVDPQLFDAIVNQCADPSRLCMREIMHIDAAGGGGLLGGQLGKDGLKAADLDKLMAESICRSTAPINLADNTVGRNQSRIR